MQKATDAAMGHFYFHAVVGCRSFACGAYNGLIFPLELVASSDRSRRRCLPIFVFASIPKEHAAFGIGSWDMSPQNGALA